MQWTLTFWQPGTDLCAAVRRAPVSGAIEPIGDGHTTAEADWQQGKATDICLKALLPALIGCDLDP